MRSVLKNVIRPVIGKSSGQSCSSYWANQPEVLFFANDSVDILNKVVSTQLPNEKVGATDYLTVTGSGLNARYRTPNTTAYKNADTDYCFWKTDASERTCDGNRLIGYDFTRTIVKYLDISPYTIQAIMILSSNVDTAKMRNDFHLSIWWDNILSAYGYLKGNRGIGQNIWSPYPIVVTSAISLITNATASSGGNVTSEGPSSVTVRGVCWSTSANPTIALATKTSDGSGIGIFTSSLTGLSSSTVYHVRAYATNSEGTSYGSDIQFTTINYVVLDTFTDTNNVHLHDHTMDVGTGWTAPDSFIISGNKLINNAPNGSGFLNAITQSGKTDVDITMDVTMVTTASTHLTGIIFRYSDSSHMWALWLEKDEYSPYLTLYKDAASVAISASFTDENITSQLRVSVIGNDIKCYWKDMVTPLISFTDATYNDKTICGVRAYRSSGPSYEFLTVDNFKIS